jgi:hypothetical protein
MRIIFICLCILAGVIEGATVLLIFRSAVNTLFERKQQDVTRLSGIKDNVVNFKLGEIEAAKKKSKQAKNHGQSKGKRTKFATKGDGSDSDSGSSSDESDFENKRGAVMVVQDDEGDEDADGDSGAEGKANQTNQKNEDDTESAGGKRQNILAVLYYTCLFFILVCLAFLGYQCVFAITKAETTASELNGASRRSYLAERMAYFSHELIYANDVTTFVGSKALSIQSSLDGLRCQLTRSVQALLSTHYAMLYGAFWGWQDLPHKQYWANGPVLWWHDGDSCSPFTWDEPSFFATAVTPGSVNRPQAGEQDMTYFGKQCLAKLSAKNKAENSVSYSSPRILEFVKKFYESDKPCGGFDRVPEQDPVVSQGLHSLIIYMTDLALMLAETPDVQLLPNSREYTSFVHRDNDEWQLGLQKSVLLYQSEALIVIEQTTTYVTILYIFILLVVAAQYLFLGRRIEGLMQEHIGMSAIVDRFKTMEERTLKTLKKIKDTTDEKQAQEVDITRQRFALPLDTDSDGSSQHSHESSDEDSDQSETSMS